MILPELRSLAFISKNKRSKEIIVPLNWPFSKSLPFSFKFSLPFIGHGRGYRVTIPMVSELADSF